MPAPLNSSRLPFLLGGVAAALIGTATASIASLDSMPPAMKLAGAQAGTTYASTGDYGRIALRFERNVGQAGGEVQYLARGAGYGLFLEPDTAVLGLRHPAAGSSDDGHAAATAVTSFIRAQLVGANAKAPAEAEAPLSSYSNYLIGMDARRWHTHVPQFGRVRYRDVYPQVDLVYYGNEQQLEYDFVVAAGGNPESIRLHYAGIDTASIDAAGDLHLRVDGADLIEHKPTIYQTRDGARVPVDGRYSIVHNDRQAVDVAFAVADYDRTRPLVIDPILSYSSFISGLDSGTPGGVAVDQNGNAYLAGSTVAVDFPVTEGIPQTNNAGGSDAFVTKFSADGKSLVYSTYLGGSLDDTGSAIAVDANGAAYVGGNTSSADFPVTAGAFQATISGTGTSDAFVSKLSPDGSTLVYSSFLGGSQDENTFGIAVDTHGAAYVTGQTFSKDFPFVTGGIAKTMSGKWDTFLTKISADGTKLLHSTYFGGVNDNPGAVVVDSTGAAYVAGSTTSSFPTTNGAYQTTNAGSRDAYASKVSADGKSFVYSTFLGGTGSDGALGIAVDGTGAAYVTGGTASTNFPVTTGAYITHKKTRLSGSFVTKLSADGSSLVYSTYLDGTEQESANGIAIDSLGRAYVTGSTQSSDFPVTAGAPQPVYGGGTDAFVSLLNAAGSNLVYSTYMGGSNSDSGKAVAVDSAGNAYVTGITSSTNFPTTEGAYQTRFKVTVPNATEVFAFRFAPFTANPSSLAFGDITAGQTSTTQALTFSNGGISTVSIDSITTETSQYPFTTTCGSSLATGANCSISVKFAPTDVGALPDTLTIATSDGPALVPLSGTGDGKGATLSPGSLLFADQLVGSSSSSQFVTITNNGTTTVNIGSITTSTGFTQTNSCVTIAPGSNCPVNVRFAPVASGPANGTLTVKTDAFKNPAPVTLTGTGIAPVVSLSVTSLDFGNRSMGTTSGKKTVQLTNTGTARLVLSAITTTGPFAQTNTCGNGLEAGAQCSISATFTPVSLGALTGKINIASNAATSPNAVNLTGTGVGPLASLSVTSLAFGNQAINTTSAAKVVTVTNIGTTALTISSVAASPDFTETTTCGKLTVGKSCTINVSFAPTTAGSSRGDLSITSDAFDSPDTVKLSGTGILVPAVSLSPTALNFGNRALGTTSGKKTVTLTNTGTGPLTITSIVASTQFAQTSTCGNSVAAGANCTISVTYSPTSTGTLNGTLTVTTNASTSPDVVSLTGTGTGALATLAPTSLAFAPQPVTTTSRSQTVTVTNAGTTALTISSVAVSSGFVQSNACSSVFVGKSCLINVSFAPTVTGPANGSLTIKTNAYDSPSKVSLSGSGT